MTDTNAQEPTMEEILASIRRIISEDDAPASDASATPPGAVEAAPEPEPAAAPPVFEEDQEDDVLELTEPMAPPRAAAPPPPEPAPPAESVGDLDVFPRSPPPAPPRPAPAPAPRVSDEPLVSSRAAEAAASHFGQLAQSIAMPKEGRTLEDVVRELLKPLLKDWLDANLPSIVEARVQAEVERLSRGRY